MRSEGQRPTFCTFGAPQASHAADHVTICPKVVRSQGARCLKSVKGLEEEKYGFKTDPKNRHRLKGVMSMKNVKGVKN